MADETADALREMALHRGLKLVRSRRRKPGSGDFGKFGLTDDKGKELLGFGTDGLTASAEEIEDFLRAGATSTWQQSAKITPDRKRSVSSKTAKPREEDSRATGNGPKRDEPEKRSQAPTPANNRGGNAAPDNDAASASQARRAAASRASAAARHSPPPAPAPEPELKIRSIKPADADAIVPLLNQLSGVTTAKADVTRSLGQIRKSGGEVSVAELGGVVGCIAWTVAPTLQRGLVGRITLLVVDSRHRRRGIGTKLLETAEEALKRKTCALIEVMSDIDLKNSHGFFRELGFEQKSYRFIRTAKRD
jgi:ribosomal protein S18 acetylase RimI-like enzyme